MNKITTILVISDTHSNNNIISYLTKNIPHDYSVIAGDFESDDSFILEHINYIVRGNNDWNSSFPDELNFEIEGIKFHLEHGHLTGNYFQLDNYKYMHKKLIKSNCDVFIHGHTHIPKIFEYEEGIVINPGSTTYPRGGSSSSYAIITIDNNKNVQCNIYDI